MARLNTLKPRIAALDTRRIKLATVSDAQRLRGRPWMRIRERILARDKGLCQCDQCQRSGFPQRATEVDHRIPLWEGGTDDDANLQSMHPDCHRAKTEAEAARRARLGWAPTSG